MKAAQTNQPTADLAAAKKTSQNSTRAGKSWRQSRLRRNACERLRSFSYPLRGADIELNSAYKMINGFNIAPRFKPNARAVVFEGDCREMLRDVPTSAIQLVVTSPPYNLGKEYESRLHLNDYLSQQREVISECVRALSDGGSICWEVGNYVDDGAIIPLDSLLYPIFADLGLKMRNRIVWHFEHGMNWRN